MQLGIDLRCLPADGSPGAGIAHAARAIAQSLCERHGDEIVLYIPAGARHRRAPTANAVALADVRRGSLVRALKDHPCDALFVPSGAVPIGLPVPGIPWVHDVDIFSHPEWFPQSFLKRKLTTGMFLRGIRHAPMVFTVSEYTKRELLKIVSYPKEKIIVTGEGGDPALASWNREEAGRRLASKSINRPFVLMLGTVEPRKNIQFITDLWSAASRHQPDVDLVIAGKDGWKVESINEAINRAEAIRPSDVDEMLKRDLLVSATLIVTPSLSEGFGLVPLEAIQAGTPVIVSDQGALPEIVGRGEWVVPLEDRKAWIEMIVRLLEDESYRNEIAGRQSSIAGKNTWEFAGSLIWDSIQNIIK